MRKRSPMNPALARLAVIASICASGPCLSGPGPGAQELSWSNPGNYDYNQHNNKMPAEPDLPPGLPPGFDAVVAHPSSLNVKVSGMDFLADGRMVLVSWGDFGRNGVVYLLDGMAGDKESIKATVIAKDIWEPFGVKVMKDEIFFTAQDGMWKLVRTAASPEKWEQRSVAKYILPIKALGGDFPIAFNTTWSAVNGKFYYGIGAYKNFNPPGQNEGYVVSVDKETGAQEILGRGIRMPNGIGANMLGDIFYADNQGEYRPSSDVFHVVKGRHYGMAAPDGKDGNLGGAMTRFLPLPSKDSIFPPAICIPYRPGSASLTNMFYLDHTQFEGQFLIGDNAFGGVHRVFLEKVKGEYQGAYFQFSSVLEGGIQSFASGPDGAIYGGTLGHAANGWFWLGKEEGLVKWKPNGKPLSSILSVSSQREGFDIRFTEALAGNAANPDWFWVDSYRYEPTSNYGGPKIDVQRMKIAKIRVSADRKTVGLSVEGLQAGRVYRIDLAPDLKTVSGNPLFTRNAWYTLNRISDAEILSTSTSAITDPKNDPRKAATGLDGRGPAITEGFGKVGIRIAESGKWQVLLSDVNGKALARLDGQGPMSRDIAYPAMGIRFLKIVTASGVLTRILGAAR